MRSINNWYGLPLLTVLLIVTFCVISITFAAAAADVTDYAETEAVVTAKLDRDPSEAIKETFPITLCIDGETRELHTGGGTVGELLARWDIAPALPDYVRPAAEALLVPGMKVEIVRVTTAEVSEETAIPFSVERVASEYVWKGKEVVKQEGIDGLQKTTYKVIYENGTEISREAIVNTVLEEAQTQIVEYGCGGTIKTADRDVLHYVMKLNVKATAYTTEGYDDKITATGTVAHVGSVAVDPKVIPLGSEVYVTARNGKSWVYGEGTCEDTGGVIKGNKIDLFFDTRAECFTFGRRNAVIYILESE